MKKQIFIMLGIVVVMLGIGFLLFQSEGGTPQPTIINVAEHTDSYVLGPAKAKITVVEFADFQCPGCGASAPMMEQLNEMYKDQVRIVFRHFPLQQHKNARLAAVAAEAAGEQGKFWEMYKTLFGKQTDWSELAKPASLFVSYAKELGLDTTKFEQDLASTKYNEKIERDIKEALGYGVNSTPTFFVNGEKFVGVPGSAFKNKIEELIKN